MPTYDYLCDACGHKFELYQSIMAPVKRKCPECGKSKLRRLIGAGAAIMFKGSGFYHTDYRSEGYKKRAEADKPAESKPAESSETKSTAASDGAAKASDAKPAAKESSSKSTGSKSQHKKKH